MTDNNNIQQGFPLRGKVALVTGAGRGIGRAIALAWAAAGAKVSCAARSKDQLDETVALIQKAGSEGLAVPTDVTDHTQVKALVEATVQAFGGLDLVLINAGGSFSRNWVGEDQAEDWVNTIHLNLTSAFYTAREVIAPMKARGGGRILTMGSGAGHRGMPGNSSYAVAKSGMWMLVRVLAQELMEHNISVNEIIPGPVNTFLTQGQEKSDKPSPFKIPNEWVKAPEDVVPMAMFLATHPEPGPTAQSFSIMRRDK